MSVTKVTMDVLDTLLIGSAARSFLNLFSDQINLRNYASVGDGTTVEQTGVAAAVAAAFAAGKDLYWPAGTYLTNANIANFHSVRHRGPGILKRGSGLFYVDPSMNSGQTNILYVSTTGSNTNDGLSSSEPRLTAQSMCDVIYTYSYGNVTWKIQFAAGTYTATTSFNARFPTPQRVWFVGAGVNDGTVPTTIFDSPGGSSQSGLFLQEYVRAYVEDIKFTNYKDGGGIAYGGSSSGINATEFVDLHTRNCHFNACDCGIRTSFYTRSRIQAGVINACGIGVIAIGGAQYTIGYQGSAADITGATGTAITGCIGGVLVQESSDGHADYCYFGTNTTGLNITINSRCHLLGSTLISNTTAVYIALNSVLYDSTVTNTYTTNVTDVQTFSGGRRSGATNYVDEEPNFGPNTFLIETATSNTQSLTPVTFFTKNFVAKEFQVRGSGFKMRLDGDVVGVAGTKTLVFTLGATALLTAVIAAATTDFSIEVDLWTRTATNDLKLTTKIFQNGVLPVVNVASIATEDLTAAKTLTITGQVANAADRLDAEIFELEVCH